jgi:hypothetical protein
MTYKEAAQTALQVQNAVNLSGVVKTFAEVTSVLWDEARKFNMATDWVNSHPICTLFIEVIAGLNGYHDTGNTTQYLAALREVRAIASEPMNEPDEPVYGAIK